MIWDSLADLVNCLNPDLSFTITGCHAKLKDLFQTNYSSVAGGKTVGFIPFPIALEQFNSTDCVHFLQQKPVLHKRLQLATKTERMYKC